MGDFNARTGKHDDFIEIHMNNFGKSLLNLFQVYGVHIANGRFPGDASGVFTFCSSNGTSVVDYVLASSSLFTSKTIANFLIDNKTNSDHLPIILDISCNTDIANINNRNCDNTNEYNRYKWSSDHEQYLLETLRDHTTRQLLSKFEDDIAIGNIDMSVSTLVHIIQRPAKPMKCKPSSHFNSHSHTNANWWDSECSQARQDSNRLLTRFRNSGAENDLELYCQAKRYYSRICKEKHRVLQNQNFKTVREGLS